MSDESLDVWGDMAYQLSFWQQVWCLIYSFASSFATSSHGLFHLCTNNRASSYLLCLCHFGSELHWVAAFTVTILLSSLWHRLVWSYGWVVKWANIVTTLLGYILLSTLQLALIPHLPLCLFIVIKHAARKGKRGGEGGLVKPRKDLIECGHKHLAAIPDIGVITLKLWLAPNRVLAS